MTEGFLFEYMRNSFYVYILGMLYEDADFMVTLMQATNTVHQLAEKQGAAFSSVLDTLSIEAARQERPLLDLIREAL